MGITGDRYTATYEGHTLELVRNNWNKTLNLLVDGEKVAGESRIFPHTITLTATLVHNGESHIIVAHSQEHMLSTVDTITIDGQDLPLDKTR